MDMIAVRALSDFAVTFPVPLGRAAVVSGLRESESTFRRQWLVHE